MILMILIDCYEKLDDHRKFFYKETNRSSEIAISKIQRKISPSVMEKGRDSTITPTLFDGVKENRKEEKALFFLSKKQEHTLGRFMNHQGYRFLKGHAGTGKTVLIIARARIFSRNFSQSQNFNHLLYFSIRWSFSSSEKNFLNK